jgi:subtilisin family serine protease
MHGPAVLSLLAGQHCGVAPEARVHFFATTDPGGDAAEQAQAIEWVLEANRQLPPSERIRVISISAAPSGRSVYPYRNGEAYDEAFDRAEAANVLVIDGTEHHGFVGPCTLDLADPEDPSRCHPVPARGEPGYFAGRVLCPTSPRTTAEEFGPGVTGYQHSGLQRETHAMAGSSWAMPYAAGVAALAWQIRPDLSPKEVREALRATAYRLPTGESIIHPPALIDHLRRTGSVPAEPSVNTGEP